MGKQRKTSWESSAKWYDQTVKEKGHYYHEKVILPKLLPLLELDKTRDPSVLDLACGQGVFARSLPPKVTYAGVDISTSLIASAKKRGKNQNHQFFVGDLNKKLPLKKRDFSHAFIILALQNLENPEIAIQSAFAHLREKGKFLIVLNHPCFRIPRQTHWGFDEGKKCQYRRIDHYLSPLKIPIKTHPGKEKSEETWSFHRSLSFYTKCLREAGFVLLEMEEWVSDKKSTGSRAAMENRARKEIPLFLTLVAEKS